MRPRVDEPHRAGFLQSIGVETDSAHARPSALDRQHLWLVGDASQLIAARLYASVRGRGGGKEHLAEAAASYSLEACLSFLKCAKWRELHNASILAAQTLPAVRRYADMAIIVAEVSRLRNLLKIRSPLDERLWIRSLQCLGWLRYGDQNEPRKKKILIQARDNLDGGNADLAETQLLELLRMTRKDAVCFVDVQAAELLVQCRRAKGQSDSLREAEGRLAELEALERYCGLLKVAETYRANGRHGDMIRVAQRLARAITAELGLPPPHPAAANILNKAMAMSRQRASAATSGSL